MLYAGFLRGGGGKLKIFGTWDIHAAKLQAVARGVWGHAPQENLKKNGAISCVLRAIFNHFHYKNPLKKL